jgi:hydrogenase maturation protease
MNTALIDAIVRAVLYERYMLYPYRPSAVKNQQRFNFGVVFPRAYCEAQRGAESWTMQTECLVQGNGATQCLVWVRFLRMVDRSIGKVLTPLSNLSSITPDNVEKVEQLEIGNRVYQTWQEAVEEEIEVTEFNLSALAAQPMQWPFRLSARQERETVRNEGGLIAGIIQRNKASVGGTVELSAQHLNEDVYKFTVRLMNCSWIENIGHMGREEALTRSLISAHTILEVRDGEFVSLVDPPENCRDFAAACQNVGTWPVLVGEEGERDTMLSSPIILYDYPQVAPESPGDLFDGAEIDEILSLRIMTLTEEEKREMRQSDDRARQILERTENMPDEQWMKFHGALRGLRSAKGERP